jgi:hypothetical protein
VPVCEGEKTAAYSELEEIDAVGGTNLKPIVMEVIAPQAVADLHENMLNSRLKEHVAADGVLIVALANVFGPAAALTLLIISALPTHLLAIA